MFSPHHDPEHYQHQHKRVSSTFSLLCWNIHKENLDPHFQLRLDNLLISHPSDFILMQEYKMPKYKPYRIKELSYAMAANIETKAHIYGLITASHFGFDGKQIERTRQRELLIATQKSMLITSHSFGDGSILKIVNMHGINFVSSKRFKEELKRLESLLVEHFDTMIVCGDFNNWSKKRVDALEAFSKTLSLQKALLTDSHHVKHIFSRPVDHVFYRGVRLLKAEAIDTLKISDHNPIYTVFEKI